MMKASIAAVALIGLVTPLRAQQPTGAMDTTRSSAAVAPLASQARGVDAEIRVALYDLMANHPVPALRRLQWLANSPSALGDPAGAVPALRGRQDLLFLLAEAQYRFGMDSAFRATARQIVNAGAPSRYAPLLGAQTLLAAYRSGDYARVAQLAKTNTNPATLGLTALVSGLAYYQLHNYAEARSAFAAARQSGAPYGQYATYMDILTGLRADTAQAQSALTQLQTLASSASGGFADQVRLTAAQLAYQSGAYPQAITLADAVSPSSGFAAQAMLTKAWAQYKSQNVDGAGQTFAAFADHYAQLPERDEARLMAGQSLLQLGKTDEAGRIFKAVSDSAAGEVRILQAGAQGAMTDAARALVSARAAGLLFIGDPSVGKTVELQDAAGADPQVLAAAVADSVTAAPAIAASDLVSLSDVSSRFGQLSALSAAFPKRLLFTPASAGGAHGMYASRVQTLYAADVSVAIARSELNEQLRAYAMQTAMLKQLQTLLASRREALAQMATSLAATQQQLAQLLVRLDAAAARIHTMLAQQVDGTREAATDNRRVLDSMRTSLGPALVADDRTLLDTEDRTAYSYQQTAEFLVTRIDTIINRNPVFALRDTVRARGDSVRGLLVANQTALAAADQIVASELTRLQSGEPSNITRARSVVAAAETGRTTAESQLVAAVDTELRARAGELLAGLRRDTEAADFGTASASFFQTLDQGRPNGAAGTSGAADAGAPVASTKPSSPKQK